MKKRDESELVDIHADIIVERENHKGIVVGKRGDMLKKIGTRPAPTWKRCWAVPSTYSSGSRHATTGGIRPTSCVTWDTMTGNSKAEDKRPEYSGAFFVF